MDLVLYKWVNIRCKYTSCHLILLKWQVIIDEQKYLAGNIKAISYVDCMYIGKQFFYFKIL